MSEILITVSFRVDEEEADPIAISTAITILIYAEYSDALCGDVVTTFVPK